MPQTELDDLSIVRHSLTHILAMAVTRLYPQVKLGVGSASKTGFYGDFDLDNKRLSPVDLDQIEAQMIEIVQADLSLVPLSLDLIQAHQWLSDNHQSYRLKIVEALQRDDMVALSGLDYRLMGLDKPLGQVTKTQQLTGLSIADFQDICAHRHISRTGQIGAFKLVGLSGAYWRGRSDQPQLQRISGLAFKSRSDLEQHQIAQARQREFDHRVIGKQQRLFMFSELVGTGLPLWLPAGARLRRQLERFIVDEEIARGYQHVITPELARLDLYRQSQHYPYYQAEMYAPITIDKQQFMLRPMACPHHFQVYLNRPRSYRELPVRLAELAKLYRYEKSGELSGLIRVRSFTLADAHIICRPDQVEDEIIAVLDLIDTANRRLGLGSQNYRYRLSLGDRNDTSKYYQDDQVWDLAEEQLRQVLTKRGRPFDEVANEAAFYGPKIDLQMTNTNGQEESVFTVQYDFVMPHRFGLNYVDSGGQSQLAVVIHRSSIGAIERLVAFLLEHFKGNLPFWLSPNQLRLIPVSDQSDITELASSINQQAIKGGLSSQVDWATDSVAKKIRRAALEKVACSFVIGNKEVASGQLSPKLRPDLTGQPTKEVKLPRQQLLDALIVANHNRSLDINW